MTSETYVSSPIANLSNQDRVRMKVKIRTVMERDFADEEYYCPLSRQTLIDGRLRDDHHPLEVYAENMLHLRNASRLIAFNPDLSIGSHYEIGYADARGIPVHIYVARGFDHGSTPFMLARHIPRLEW